MTLDEFEMKLSAIVEAFIAAQDAASKELECGIDALCLPVDCLSAANKVALKKHLKRLEDYAENQGGRGDPIGSSETDHSYTIPLGE